MSAEIYQEEIYRIPEPLIIAITDPWSVLSEESRLMLTNLSIGLKLTPAPRFIQCGRTELADPSLSGSRVLGFGHTLAGVEIHKPVDYQGMQVLLTHSPEEFHGNAELKKELWAAIQLLVRN
jgi:hypothetical protein